MEFNIMTFNTININIVTTQQYLYLISNIVRLNVSYIKVSAVGGVVGVIEPSDDRHLPHLTCVYSAVTHNIGARSVQSGRTT